LAGHDAAKERPACIVLAVHDAGRARRVLIVPITRSMPGSETPAMELPAKVKQHLGMDEQRSWIVLSEANIDTWPSPDLRLVPGRRRFDYGLLPLKLTQQLRRAVLQALRDKTLGVTKRD
jgi:hypothetical protein